MFKLFLASLAFGGAALGFAAHTASAEGVSSGTSGAVTMAADCPPCKPCPPKPDCPPCDKCP